MQRIIMRGSIANGLSKHSSKFSLRLINDMNLDFNYFSSSYSLFENELVFVDRLIGADLRNNSAWNQRYFVLNHTGFSDDVIQYEINYVMNRIRLVKNNESTWNYLRGLLQHGSGKLDQYPEVSGIQNSYIFRRYNQHWWGRLENRAWTKIIHKFSAPPKNVKRFCATNTISNWKVRVAWHI